MRNTPSPLRKFEDTPDAKTLLFGSSNEPQSINDDIVAGIIETILKEHRIYNDKRRRAIAHSLCDQIAQLDRIEPAQRIEFFKNRLRKELEEAYLGTTIESVITEITQAVQTFILDFLGEE